jgi:isopenicillin-N epimerase
VAIIRAVKELWHLEPGIAYLNHGSFGATPRAVLAKQDEYRLMLEREPVRFMVRELEPLLDRAREVVAAFVGAAPESIAFVPNATAGVNAVLRSLDLDKHDELLVTSQEYDASRNALDYATSLTEAKVRVVDIPFPIASSDVVIERVLEAVTDRTRLLLIDHVVSQTALVFPIERIVQEMSSRGIDTLVDGAHAPGMLPLHLDALGAAYYTGNLHKWVCAPKGAAFLHVRKNRRASIRPVAISHGAASTREDRSRFHLEFDWTGTFDPSAWLAAADAIQYIPTLVDGGWPEVMRRNRALALAARDLLCESLGIAAPAPDDMIGSMAALPFADSTEPPSIYGDPLQDALLDRFGIEVPLMPWPARPARLLRISAFLYNTLDEYRYLATSLGKLAK